MILTGSRAIQSHFKDYPYIQEASDWDYIVFDDLICSTTKGAEYLYADCHKSLIKYIDESTILPADLIYTIKISHMAWEGKNNKWLKHLKDIQFLKDKGCQLNQEVFAIFYNEWQKRFGDKSHIKLNVSSEEFFNGNVTREYNHDYLHEYFKIGDTPIYKLMLIGDKDVMVDMKIFNKFDYTTKLQSALEEMFVVAAERQITLYNAYKKLVTTMTKGEWNKFLIMNSKELLDGFTSEKLIYKQKRRKLYGN